VESVKVFVLILQENVVKWLDIVGISGALSAIPIVFDDHNGEFMSVHLIICMLHHQNYLADKRESQ
jgi:hypothetical protein